MTCSMCHFTYDFPEGLRVGNFLIDQGNITLCGIYGCLGEQVMEIRDEIEGGVVQAVLDENVMPALRVVCQSASQSADLIRHLGGIPYAVPVVLNEALLLLLGAAFMEANPLPQGEEAPQLPQGEVPEGVDAPPLPQGEVPEGAEAA